MGDSTTEQNSTRLLLSVEIYPQAALTQAAQAYAPFLDIEVLEEGPQGSIVQLTPLGEANDEQAMHEFLNYVLNLSIEHYLNAGQ